MHLLNLRAAVVVALAAPRLAAQVSDRAADAGAQRSFVVGERLTYAIKLGRLGRGTATAEIVNLDTIRGREVFHSTFKIAGSVLFFRVNDFYESWFDPNTVVSLRYHQYIDEGAYERVRKYEIIPERAVYVDPNVGELPTVAMPLDEGTLLYFLRTIPLEIGQTYTFDRYFKPDRNPIRLTVVRRGRIKVPAGEFDAILLQPRVQVKGIFSEDAKAEVWVAADDTRIMLMMRANLPFGNIQFQLRRRELLTRR